MGETDLSRLEVGLRRPDVLGARSGFHLCKPVARRVQGCLGCLDIFWTSTGTSGIEANLGSVHRSLRSLEILLSTGASGLKAGAGRIGRGDCGTQILITHACECLIQPHAGKVNRGL